jgi:hypothetical protein
MLSSLDSSCCCPPETGSVQSLPVPLNGNQIPMKVARCLCQMEHLLSPLKNLAVQPSSSVPLTARAMRNSLSEVPLGKYAQLQPTRMLWKAVSYGTRGRFWSD